MMTINEVSRLTGVSSRTLRYYDSIDLLKPTMTTPAGYRLYDDAALDRLQQILLYKVLAFPLKEIKTILDAPNFDRNKALEQQIELLTMKQVQLEKLIDFARKMKKTGEKIMDYSVFDTQKIEEYAKKAKAQWGKTDAYREYEQRTKNRNEGEKQTENRELMGILAEFETLRNLDPSEAVVQLQVKKLQDYITAHFYHCTKTILKELGQMYTSGEFKANIDRAGGEGTAEYAAKAIAEYCK